MKVIAVIPARYASTRFPAKLLQDLGGKTVIRRTYEAALNTQLFEQVWVVTDSELIFDEIKSHGGQVMRSVKDHESGSDRIAEAVAELEVDIVVNIQGDEPFVDHDSVLNLIEVFKQDTAKQIDLASLMRPLTNPEEIQNPNNVKVVTDQNGLALYFSRAVIPFPRDGQWAAGYFQHLGIYAFRKQALLEFSKWPVSQLESTEKLEQLRYLEHGKKIKMVITNHIGIGIDTLEDLERARRML